MDTVNVVKSYWHNRFLKDLFYLGRTIKNLKIQVITCIYNLNSSYLTHILAYFM